jgi:hypothetical protein
VSARKESQVITLSQYLPLPSGIAAYDAGSSVVRHGYHVYNVIQRQNTLVLVPEYLDPSAPPKGCEVCGGTGKGQNGVEDCRRCHYRIHFGMDAWGKSPERPAEQGWSDVSEKAPRQTYCYSEEGLREALDVAADRVAAIRRESNIVVRVYLKVVSIPRAW